MKFEFALGPPRVLAAALILTHAGAVVATFLAGIALAWKIAILVALCASLVWQLRRLGAELAVAIEENGACTIRAASGERQGVIADHSFVSSALIILNVRAERTLSIVITPERLDADTFRRLRVFLRWGMHQDTPDDAVNMNTSTPGEQT